MGLFRSRAKDLDASQRQCNSRRCHDNSNSSPYSKDEPNMDAPTVTVHINLKPRKQPTSDFSQKLSALLLCNAHLPPDELSITTKITPEPRRASLFSGVVFTAPSKQQTSATSTYQHPLDTNSGNSCNTVTTEGPMGLGSIGTMDSQSSLTTCPSEKRLEASSEVPLREHLAESLSSGVEFMASCTCDTHFPASNTSGSTQQSCSCTKNPTPPLTSSQTPCDTKNCKGLVLDPRTPPCTPSSGTRPTCGSFLHVPTPPSCLSKQPESLPSRDDLKASRAVSLKDAVEAVNELYRSPPPPPPSSPRAGICTPRDFVPLDLGALLMPSDKSSTHSMPSTPRSRHNTPDGDFRKRDIPVNSEHANCRLLQHLPPLQNLTDRATSQAGLELGQEVWESVLVNGRSNEYSTVPVEVVENGDSYPLAPPPSPTQMNRSVPMLYLPQGTPRQDNDVARSLQPLEPESGGSTLLHTLTTPLTGMASLRKHTKQKGAELSSKRVTECSESSPSFRILLCDALRREQLINEWGIINREVQSPTRPPANMQGNPQSAT